MGCHDMEGLMGCPTDPAPTSSQKLSGELQTSPVGTGHTNDPIGMWLG